MNVQELRARRRFLYEQNKRYGKAFSDIPESEWPPNHREESRRIAVFRSRDFLVQMFAEQNGIVRLSICRTELNNTGAWKDNISWDELQDIKNSVGFANTDAVEVFPAKDDKVNVANMRHLFVMSEPLKFAWRKQH